MLATLSLMLALAPRWAHARSCELGTDYLGLHRDADALFIGVVEAARPSAILPLTRGVGRLRVLATWKGASTDQIALGHYRHYLFEKNPWAPGIGETLVVLAYRDRLGLVTSLDGCGALTLQHGRRLFAPLPAPVPPGRTVHLVHLWFWGPWYLLLAGAALLAGGAGRWHRRRVRLTQRAA